MSQTPPSQPAPMNPLGDHTPHKEADDREEVYFHGSPMMRGELGKVFVMFLIALVLAVGPFLIPQARHSWPWWAFAIFIVVALLVLLIPILITKSYRYKITNYRIDYERGILGKRIDTLELWHVEDIQFAQSLLERMMGVGTITIISHDDTTPKLVMRSLPDPRPLYETLKQRVIAVKRQRGVVKMDFGGSGDVSPS